MSRSGLQSRTDSKRNKQSCNGSRNGKCSSIENDVLRTVRQFGSEVSRTVKQRAAGFRDTAKGCLKQGRKKARSLERTAQRRVEEQPIRSLLAAAGIGLLIGVLAGRRR